MRGLCLLLVAVAIGALASGCVGPTGGGDECLVPGAGDSVNYILTTSNGTRTVPTATAARWVVIVTCDETQRDLTELSLRIVTDGHGELVAEPEEALGKRLTLYAEPQAGSGEDTPMDEGLPPPAKTPAYRLRIHNDGRDKGIDTGDWLELGFDDDGDRDFQDALPPGEYRMQVRDRESGEGLGLVVHRVYPAGFGN